MSEETTRESDERQQVKPSERELQLARGFMALLRTHEEAGDPQTWTSESTSWGDGRETVSVYAHTDPGCGYPLRELVCQFRPNDPDAALSSECVSAVQRAHALATSILGGPRVSSCVCPGCGGSMSTRDGVLPRHGRMRLHGSEACAWSGKPAPTGGEQ